MKLKVSFDSAKGNYELGGLTALGSAFDANAEGYVKEEVVYFTKMLILSTRMTFERTEKTSL